MLRCNETSINCFMFSYCWTCGQCLHTMSKLYLVLTNQTLISQLLTSSDDRKVCIFHSIYYRWAFHSIELYFITSKYHRHSCRTRGPTPTTPYVLCVNRKKFVLATILGKDVLTFSHKVELSSVKTRIMWITLCITRS